MVFLKDVKGIASVSSNGNSNGSEDSGANGEERPLLTLTNFLALKKQVKHC